MNEAEPGETAALPFVIGVTGAIGCGKSTVMRMLADLGAFTTDADDVYHELIQPGAPLAAAIQARFGDSVAASDGGVDRRALAAIVFSDPAALADLDRITHPAVIDEVSAQIRRVGPGIVAVDAVKLVESGMDRLCDTVWLVICSPDEQLRRLMIRNGMTEAEARQRLAAQAPDAARRARAHVMIDNSGGLEATRAQVEVAWNQATGSEICTA